ncbi:MAG: DUF4386 domain-containing protein [Hellea sp.]|nr:DUF4386 domain-containing protein [Hellea sp.]
MTESVTFNIDKTARAAGWALLGSIVVGILGAVFVAKDIDINMSADIVGTAEAMLDAETRLMAKAYLGLLTFALALLTSIGLYLILKTRGQLLAAWSLLVALGGAVLVLLGSVYAMNAAQIGGNEAFETLASAEQRHLLAGLQTTSDYTSFHLGLVLSSSGNAGFFYLFLKSGLIPKIIAGWGLFASLFVAVMIVARDFIPALGHNGITATFMVSNLIAILATGFYLAIKGVRTG